jgi:hypothetical protein
MWRNAITIQHLHHAHPGIQIHEPERIFRPARMARHGLDALNFVHTGGHLTLNVR